MRKRTFRVALATAVIFALLLLGLLYWLQGNSFRDWLSHRIDRELEKYNLCLEAEQLRVDPFALQAEFINLKISACDNREQPILAAGHVYIKVRARDLFAGKFELKDLVVSEPRIYVSFDAQGRANFAAIKLPPETNNQEQPQLASAVVALNSGQIIYADQRIDFSGQFNQFELTAVPSLAGGSQISLRTQQCQLKYQSRVIELEQFAARARTLKERAEIQSITFQTPIASATLSGEIKDWRALSYDLNLYTKIDLAAISKTFLPEQPLTGQAEVRGHLTGQGSDYRFQGQFTSADLNAHGLHATDFDLQSELASMGNQLTLTGALRLGGAQYQRITVKALQGSLRATPDAIELADFEIGLWGGQAQGTANLALNESRSRLKLKFEGIDLTTLNASLLTRPDILAGKVKGLVEASWPGLKFNAISGQIKVDFQGNTIANSQYTQTLPLSGEFEGAFAGNTLQIRQAEFIGGKTTVSLSGTASQQTIKLNVKVDSQQIEEARRLVEQLNLITAQESLRQIDILGRFNFAGTIEGALKSPNVIGQLFVERIISEQEEVGQFNGQVRYLHNQYSSVQGALIQSGSGRIDINVETALAEGGETQAGLLFKSFRLSPAAVRAGQRFALQARLLPLFTALKNFQGEINGEINLKRLPGMIELVKLGHAEEGTNTGKLLAQMEGKLDISVENSHPQGNFRTFAVKFIVQNDQLNFSRIALGLPAGAITGAASYHTGTGDYRLDLKSDHIDLAGFTDALRERGLPATGNISIQVQGAGNTNKPVFDLRVYSQQLGLGKVSLGDFELTAHAAGVDADVNLKAIYQQRPYQVAGRIKLAGDFPLEAEIVMKERSVIPLFGLFLELPPRLEAIANGRIKIRGPLATEEGIGLSEIKFITDIERLKLQVEAQDEEDVSYVATNDGPVIIEASAKHVTFRNFNIKGEGTSFGVTGSIVAGTASSLVMRGQVNLRLLNTISRSLFVNGTADISASYGSSSGQVRFTGSMELKDVSIRYIGFPLAIQEGNGQMLFTANRAVLENFTAKAGSGQVRIGGGAIFEKGLVPSRFRVNVKADSVRMNYPESVRSLMDADLVLQGSPRSQFLSGSVNLRRTEYTDDIDLTSLILSGSRANLSSELAFGNSLSLNLSLIAQDSIVIRNNLADLVGNASIKVIGPINEPVISGRASVSRGTLFLRNDRYNITRGIVDFPETRSGRARFDVEADTELRGYRIILTMAGTLDRLMPVLRSEPSLSQSDIITLLTTGQLPPPGVSSQSIETQTRLGTAVSILTESLSERVEERTGRLFGLNRFQIDPLLAGRGSDPTARITIGRRITKDLSLTYSTNVTTGQEQIVVIEYQINRNISVIGTRDQDGSYGFDVRFRKRF
ncbi:MAG: translocation/assembly module TamB domain-containing protein [Acidobacteriota bacterium]